MLADDSYRVAAQAMSDRITGDAERGAAVDELERLAGTLSPCPT